MKSTIAIITLALASCTFPVEVSFKSKEHGVGATYSEKGGLTLDVDLPATITPAK